MSAHASTATDTGLEVLDLENLPEFLSRRLHVRDAAMQLEGVSRLARAFVDHPEELMQELVSAGVDLCGAQSAGISIQNCDEDGETYYRWVATAGLYSGFLNAVLPAFPSACGICLERDRPQLFRVTQKFFDLMGVDAPTVTDGLLIPWHSDGTKGTIWIMAHGSAAAFDTGDLKMMEVLANFAAMAYRQQRQQSLLMQQARVTAASAMANELAHSINNPLQSLTNLVFMAKIGIGASNAQDFAEQLSVDLDRLSSLVKRLLELKGNPATA